jgi:hypothetical protein
VIPGPASLPRRIVPAARLWRRGRVGTQTHSRELMFDHRGIVVRKLSTRSLGHENQGSEARPGHPRQSGNDSKLASLYQDTLEAPIPQDMLRLLEKLGGTGRHG